MVYKCIILLFIFVSLIFSQQGYNKAKYNGNSKTGYKVLGAQPETLWTPTFTGLDTNNFFNSWCSRCWLTYNGINQFSSLISVNADSSVYGTNLVSALTDSAEIGFWLKLPIPRKNASFIINKRDATGWSIHFGNAAGQTLEFSLTAAPTNIANFPLYVFDAADSLRRFWRLRINNLGAGGTRLRLWRSMSPSNYLTYPVAQDSLVLDTTNTGWVEAVLGNTRALTIGAFSRNNNVSDTTQKPIANTYFQGEILNPYVRKWFNNTDSLYGAFIYPAFGQTLYDSSRVKSYDRGNITGVIPVLNFNVTNGLFLAWDRYEPGTWCEIGTRPTIIDSLSTGTAFWDSTANVNTKQESYTLHGFIKRWRGSNYIVIGGKINTINFTGVDDFGTGSSWICRFNLDTNNLRAFNESTPPNNVIRAGADINDSTSIHGGLFTGITNKVRCNRVAKYNWNTDTWSEVDSGFNGDVYDLNPVLPGVIASGLFTQSGNTSGFGGVAILRSISGEWQKFGTGSDGGVLVSYIRPSNGDTIFAGSFLNFNGVPCNSICKWNGTTALPLGSGITYTGGTVAVYALCEYRDTLYAGGDFTDAGGVSVKNLAKWDGSAWRSAGDIFADLPAAVQSLGSVTRLNIVHNALYIIGRFAIIEKGSQKITSYNNVIYNGAKFYACPSIDERDEWTVIYNDIIYTGGDEWGSMINLYNNHKINTTWSVYTVIH